MGRPDCRWRLAVFRGTGILPVDLHGGMGVPPMRLHCDMGSLPAAAPGTGWSRPCVCTKPSDMGKNPCHSAGQQRTTDNSETLPARKIRNRIRLQYARLKGRFTKLGALCGQLVSPLFARCSSLQYSGAIDRRDMIFESRHDWSFA